MNISIRRLLTSITREIGDFFVCIKFFQEILKKHPPKNALPFQTNEGVNSEPRKGQLFHYFVDLTKGDPKITQNARCLHTRQDGSLTNFKGQNSGVLYIKEATKKGYKEAHEGNSIDLGFAGSNTRRGRVFAGVAHTVDTANTHGIVLRGGRVRRLMPRECFRLQGFNEDQIDKLLAINSDAQAYKQAGNSVTVTVIEAIGRRIRAADAELYTQESR